MIQDGEGRKMSKSLGNGIDPLAVIDSHGADAMRITVCEHDYGDAGHQDAGNEYEAA